MELQLYQVDAFTQTLFAGNPAAICPLTSWLPDDLMQNIAVENNLAETAFYIPQGENFELRWFTPATEVDLCGHATLATAHLLFQHLGYSQPQIRFHTRSGVLTVQRQGNLYEMDFPAQPPQPCPESSAVVQALNCQPLELLAAADYIAVLASEAEVREFQPDFERLKQLDKRGIAITAPGDTVDFVSRFFAPNYGINEDPVTGSLHCELTPYWAAKLGKQALRAQQLSARGGELQCRLQQQRVMLAGQAVTYMQATIQV